MNYNSFHFFMFSKFLNLSLIGAVKFLNQTSFILLFKIALILHASNSSHRLTKVHFSKSPNSVKIHNNSVMR